jgi:thiol-disulfide isomerase/thioredoxin/mono/diheme cytochrome c family protein
MNRTRRHLLTGLVLAAVLSALGMGLLPAGREAPDGGPASQNPLLAPPSPRDARDAGIGRYVPDAAATDLAGKPASWRTGRGEKLSVIALTSVTCPLCRKFAPSLARIEAAYAGKGVKFVFLNVSGTDTADDIRAQIRDQGFTGLYLSDTDHTLAAMLHARTTTEVFVIDAGNTLVYRGAVSDQYGLGFSHDAPRQRFLEAALDAALAGKSPDIAATSAPGCVVEMPAKPAVTEPAAITYTRDISRIIAANCLECHRTGGVAPFALDSYESVSRRASMIRSVTQEGLMPPWFAATSAPQADDKGKPSESPWANDRSLSRADKDAIAAWVAAGKPRGDDSDLPLPRTFAKGEWSIPTPDAVFQIPEPIAIKADGTMPYQNVMVPTGLTEDKWVRAMQIIPTDKSVVHHVLVFVMPEAALTDRAVRLRSAIDESRGYYAAYVPGNDSVVFPDGMAKRLPKNSVLMFQIHYTPNGKPTQDQIKIGMSFASQPPRHVVRTAAIADRRLAIPPGASNHRETASVRLPADARLLAFMPHMHVRGKAYRYELQLPGTSEPAVLLDIPRYDFNWQLRYTLREPLAAPAGSTLIGTAWYDNSENNPANPDPTQTVRWGPQTTDEMMLGYVEYYLENEDPAHPEALPPGSTPGRTLGRNLGRNLGGGTPQPPLSFDRLLTRFDTNQDGQIDKAEVPPSLHGQFDRLDRNADGTLTRDDFGQ